MNKTTVVSARVAPDLMRDTERILKALGLTTTEAITLFLNQINLRQGLPFAVEIPNAETKKAIMDGRKGIDLHEVDSVEALRKELGV
jgi:DNA-damage-inducible protein J